MLIIHATDRPSGRRGYWTLDFRGYPKGARLVAQGAMSGLTDCVWIVPGTLDLDRA